MILCCFSGEQHSVELPIGNKQFQLKIQKQNQILIKTQNPKPKSDLDQNPTLFNLNTP